MFLLTRTRANLRSIGASFQRFLLYVRSIGASSPQRSVLVSPPVHHLSMTAKVQKSNASQNIPVDKADVICLICQQTQLQSDERILGQVKYQPVKTRVSFFSRDHSATRSPRCVYLKKTHYLKNLPDFIVKSGIL